MQQPHDITSQVETSERVSVGTTVTDFVLDLTYHVTPGEPDSDDTPGVPDRAELTRVDVVGAARVDYGRAPVEQIGPYEPFQQSIDEWITRNSDWLECRALIQARSDEDVTDFEIDDRKVRIA